MKVKIISDGSKYGTQLIDPETGRDIGSALKCTRIEIAAGNPVVATLTCEGLPFEIVADVSIASTVSYDREDIDSIDKAIQHLQTERAERMRR